MAGIYIHIPFCKSKCAYCDFFSVANTKQKEEFVKAICEEIVLQKNYLGKEKIQTIYFGGGTPSMLKANQIEAILNTIHKNFRIEDNNEITLEANPDNLDRDYLKSINSLGINRLSIGIQSFNDEDLHLMRRKHTADQARKAVHDSQNEGFKNISLDLIYGLPDMTIEKWERNIEEVLNLNIKHISAYHLTIEPNTSFFQLSKKQNLNLPSEIESVNQFKLLKAKTAEKGFLQYEISNFALDGFISLHNTNYWTGVKYLGLGPSAHSYNLTSRQWNISNLHGYLDAIFKGKTPSEREILNKTEKYNDFLIISLRTMWGLNTEKLKNEFGEKYEKYFLEKAKIYCNKNLIKKYKNNFILTEKGTLISDNILQDLMFD